MPRIPVAQNDQQIQIGPSGGLEAGDPGPGIGGALTAAGSDLDVAAKQAQKDEYAVAEGGAKQQLAQYAAFRDQTLYTSDGAYYNQQGANALNTRASTEQALRDKFKDLSGQLTTPLMQKLFNQTAGTEVENDLKGIGTYAGKQAQTYNDQQDAGLQWQMAQTATTAALRGDDQGFAVAQGTMVNSIRAQNERNGLSGPYAQQVEEKAVSNLWQNIVQQTAVTDPAKAQAIFDAHRADIKDQDVTLGIEKQLEPYLKDAQSDQDASFIRGTSAGAPASAPTSDNATFAGKINHAENNTGNPAAKNPRSSAQGPDQFTDQTWLGTMKQHGPANLAAAITRQGNRYVISDQSQSGAIWAARNDPTQSHAATIALANDNKVALGRAGLPVNDGTLYLAHFLGAGGAQAVLKADPNTPIEQVTTPGARNANPKILKGTAGDVVNWAYKMMGGSSASTPTTNAPQTNDLNTQLARIDQQDWTLDRKQAAREKVMQLASVDQRLLDQQQTDAANKAWTVALDPSNTSFRSVDPTVWAAMKPEAQRSVMEAFKANAEGTNAPPNPDAYIDLADKAGKGTLTFADVRPYYGKMPKADFDHFVGLAQGIEKGDAKPQVTMDMVNSVVSNAMNASLPIKNSTIPKAQAAAYAQSQSMRRYTFQKAIMSDIDVWQEANPGKKIAATDIQAMADRRLLQTNVGAVDKGWFGSTPLAPTYQFEAKPGQPGRFSIPTADVNRIRTAGTKILGRVPSDDEVLQAYMHEPRGGL